MTARSWLGWRTSGDGAETALPSRRLSEMHFSVVDIDVTGTSLRRDRVRGIALLPVVAGKIGIADLRYCALPETGEAGPEAGWRSDYLALHQAVAGTPIVTYNPTFVRQMILRHCKLCSVSPLEEQWIDIAATAALMGSEDSELTTADYWLRKMATGGRWPHDASYDVFAMAQWLQAILAYAEDMGIDDMDSLTRSQNARAWFRKT